MEGGRSSPNRRRSVCSACSISLISSRFVTTSIIREPQFDEAILHQGAQPVPNVIVEELATLRKENERLKERLTERREEREASYSPKPLEATEFETRKLYIDTMLQAVGWVEGKDWQDEYELKGMPNAAGVGYADYVLFGEDGLPLAVIEAKKTCRDVAEGRQQAKLYADRLEKKFGRRPVIFLTNGFETRICNDSCSHERKVSGVYSKRDLEKLFNIQTLRSPLEFIEINNDITNRPYQKEAVKAVCEAFGKDNQRKALLVMATGSGKTRTVISLVDVLVRHGWVKNILFLADRTSLVVQAHRTFTALLSDLSLTNLCTRDRDYTARCVFSTYQTMMNCIDDACDDKGSRLFTPGHFDLIIVDEAHRSIYNKYLDIFNYFDALLVGLTATPKAEIDHNTYGIFDLQDKVPTYGYELAQAVKEGYLVPYSVIDTKTKFLTEGIVYSDLSEEEKADYETTFADEDGGIPDAIESSKLNEWVFNRDTIRQVLDTLMQQGTHVDYGQNVGKTIIFAKNHRHAEAILEVWNAEYRSYPPHYCEVIDNKIEYTQSLIDDFSQADRLPQIAVSVDMLDTGIDVPEVVNLVFFKKVMSKAKFWQMIGRGTRLCPELLDGKDKEGFCIFDWCGNFEFFSMSTDGVEGAAAATVQERVFALKASLAFYLQDVAYQTDELKALRSNLVSDLTAQVRKIKGDEGGAPRFAVRQHLRALETYADEKAYRMLTYEEVDKVLVREVAPLALPYEDEPAAVRFDALVYGIEVAYCTGEKERAVRACKRIESAAASLCHLGGLVPEVVEKKALLQQIVHQGILKDAGITVFEMVRTNLRDLMKYLPKSERQYYFTNFCDEVLGQDTREFDLQGGGIDLSDYREKVNYYILQHQDEEAISKLHHNVPLASDDVRSLERILWSEVGTKDDYVREYGEEPLGELVRSIVGLDQRAANQAFSEFIDNVSLDSRQIYFVRQVVGYIVKNGVMTDLSVLQRSPFDARGSFVELFDRASIAKLRAAIEHINENARLAA